jgi:hypothetical protein
MEETSTPPQSQVKIETKWYQKPEWIFVLVLLFWPLGLVLLWISKTIPLKSKIIMTSIWSVLLIIGLIMNGPKMFKRIDRIMNKIERKLGL